MEHLLILSAGDHEYAIGLTGPEQHVVEVDGERLGPLIGDCAPFYFDGQIVFAGRERQGAHHVVIDDMDVARICNGVWMTFPRPFVRGMRAAVAWRDEGGAVLRDWTTPPLERRDLEPHPDAGWTGYAPG